MKRLMNVKFALPAGSAAARASSVTAPRRSKLHGRTAHHPSPPGGGAPSGAEGRPELEHPEVEYVLSGEEAAKYASAQESRGRRLVLLLRHGRNAGMAQALRAAAAMAP